MIAHRAALPATHSGNLRALNRKTPRSKWMGQCGAVAENAATAVPPQPTVLWKDQFPQFGTEQSEYDIMDGSFDYEACRSVYDHIQEVPEGYWIDKVEGTIPAELSGTYFKNGPGDVNFLNEPVAYQLDANGLMGSVSIKDGRAFYRSRFVKSDHSMLEEKAGRRLFRSAFGTQPKNGVAPFGLFVNRNAANGKPFLGRGRLYAPYEAALQSELNPVTLETVYPTLPDGLLPATVQVLGRLLGDMTGAFERLDDLVNGDSDFFDPRKVIGIGDSWYDGRRGTTICHSCRPQLNAGTGSVGTEISIYEFDASMRLLSRQKYTVDNVSMPHAVGVSENYYVISKIPISLDPRAMLDPTIGLAKSVQIDPNGSYEFHLIPRPNRNGHSPTQKARVYKLEEPTFPLHYVNVFEEGDKVIIDAVHYPEHPLFTRRHETDADATEKTANPTWTRTVCHSNGKVEMQPLSTRRLEMCTINPNYLGRDYRYAYMNVALHPSAGHAFHGFGKVDLKSGQFDIWSKDPQLFASEPLFVPHPDRVEEDDGWVLSFYYNAKTEKTEFVIFDAKDIKNGPVATLYLKHAIAGVHAIWSNQYYGP